MNAVLVEKTQVVVLLLAILILVTVVALIRRGKLNEVYSVMWFAATAVLVVLAAFPVLLVRFSNLIGALNANSTLFFFSLVFVMVFLVHSSIRFSALREQNKNLAQDLALLRGVVEQELSTRRLREPS